MQQPSLKNNHFVQQQSYPFDTIIDVIDPMQAIQTTFILISKAFTKHYTTPINNNQRISSNTRNKHIAQLMNVNQGRQMQMVAVNAGNQGDMQTPYAGNQVVGSNAGQNGN
ncbi:hypothetical protein Tco_0467628 [Tanacetum coccineum]